MGQQQLLLIVLGVIIVGIAVVVGINLFNANAEESAKDTMVSEGTNLGAFAQQFYKKPVALAGGGNSFTTLNNGTHPINPSLLTTFSATWTYTTGDQSCSFKGVPNDVAYKLLWTVDVAVTPLTITTTVTPL